jgi:hypothetical protein
MRYGVIVVLVLVSCSSEPTCGDPAARFEARTLRLRSWPGDAAPSARVGLDVESEGCGLELRTDTPWLEVSRDGAIVTVDGDPGATGPGVHEGAIALVDPRTDAEVATLPVTLSVMEPGPEDATRHALVIGIDGCRPDALLVADAPNLEAIATLGRATYAASTQLEAPTKSGPGWASILTGVDAGKHLVDANDDLAEIDRGYPSFLARARDAGLSIGVSAQWSGIRALLEPEIAETAGRGIAREVVADAVDQLGGDVDVLFVHLDDVDIQGHTTGFSPENPAYLDAIETVDRHVGTILDAVISRSTFREERWLFVVTTDHGGAGLDHGPLDADNRTIFLLLGDPSGAPGALEGEALSHVDVAPTVLAWMGVAVDPTWGLDGVAR